MFVVRNVCNVCGQMTKKSILYKLPHNSWRKGVDYPLSKSPFSTLQNFTLLLTAVLVANINQDTCVLQKVKVLQFKSKTTNVN